MAASTPSQMNLQGSLQGNLQEYVKNHQLEAKLTTMVAKAVHEFSDDPFAVLARECAALAKNPASVAAAGGAGDYAITKVVGREILDSRGNPTVEADIYTNIQGVERLVGRSGAPSGASTGSNEAYELRDGDSKRYLGKGTTKAASNVSTVIADALKGQPLTSLRELDNILIKTDGDPLKKTYGGNAATAVSFSLAEAIARVQFKELFLVLAEEFHRQGTTSTLPSKFGLPRPMVNILNGGKHAGGDLQVQEFMIVPKAGISFKEMLRIAAEVFHHLGKILVAKKGVSSKNVGDEGGYAPLLSSPDEALTLIEDAIQTAGYKVNEDVFLALDAASSEFYKDGKYEIEKGTFLSSTELIDYYVKLVERHPAIISIEDGFDEKDYDGWKAFSARFSEIHPRIMIVGDDLYTTNTTLIKQGLEHKWAKDLLLKVNQIGTISESIDAARMIFNSGGNVITSHRSGEATNTIIADLAVAIGSQFIKTGSISRGERICKYNRLLVIEEYLQEHNLL